MNLPHPPLAVLMKRGNDLTGHGYFGAKRGTRKHKGLDLIAQPGETVFSPLAGFITKYGIVYEATDRFRYVEVTGDEFRWRLYYCSMTIKRKGDRVMAGDAIGTVQDIAKYHGGGMKNHLHAEVYRHGLLTDPEPLLFNYFKHEENKDIFAARDIDVHIGRDDILQANKRDSQA